MTPGPVPLTQGHSLAGFLHMEAGAITTCRHLPTRASVHGSGPGQEEGEGGHAHPSLHTSLLPSLSEAHSLTNAIPILRTNQLVFMYRLGRNPFVRPETG